LRGMPGYSPFPPEPAKTPRNARCSRATPARVGGRRGDGSHSPAPLDTTPRPTGRAQRENSTTVHPAQRRRVAIRHTLRSVPYASPPTHLHTSLRMAQPSGTHPARSA
ncbi:hypothetical protein B0H10DRAFT_1987348, partial [Mycena sp. CBHHK59/15]